MLFLIFVMMRLDVVCCPEIEKSIQWYVIDMKVRFDLGQSEHAKT